MTSADLSWAQVRYAVEAVSCGMCSLEYQVRHQTWPTGMHVLTDRKTDIGTDIDTHTKRLKHIPAGHEFVQMLIWVERDC